MKLRTELESLLSEYIALRGIAPGNVPVSINEFLLNFQLYVNNSIPVSKAMLGRALTKRFLKKQSRKTLEQQYFINKPL